MSLKRMIYSKVGVLIAFPTLIACDDVAGILNPSSCAGAAVMGAWVAGSKKVEFTRECGVTANVNLIGCSQNSLTYSFVSNVQGTLELTCPVSAQTSFCSYRITGQSPLKELQLTCNGPGDGLYEEFVGLRSGTKRVGLPEASTNQGLAP